MIHEISGSAGDKHGGLDVGGEFLLGFKYSSNRISPGVMGGFMGVTY